MNEYNVSIYRNDLKRHERYKSAYYYTGYYRDGLRYRIENDEVTIEPDRFVLTDRIREHFPSLELHVKGMLWLKKTTRANRYECWHFKNGKVTCKRGKLRTHRNIMFIEPLSEYDYLERWKENWICVIVPYVEYDAVDLFEHTEAGIRESILKHLEQVHSHDQRGLHRSAATLCSINASWFLIDKDDARKLYSIKWDPPIDSEEYAVQCSDKASVYRAFAKTKERPFKDL